MPKSKVRKKTDFTASSVSRTPVKVKAGPSSVWFVVLFCGLMLFGLIWLMVFQLAATGPDAPSHAELDGEPGAVELCRRVCFHDQRLVAHDAVAVALSLILMRPAPAGAGAEPATSESLDHTCVIHPHCG